MKKEIKELRSQGKKLAPLARIGKNGLTMGVVKQIDALLEERNLVKIKLLKSSMTQKDKEKFIEEIVMKTRSQLVDSVGNVIVLYRS